MPPRPGSKPTGPPTWGAFFKRTKAIYWTSFAPEMRLESRPNPPAGEPPVPDDIWQAALMVFPDPEQWLKNPIPQLGGKTPLKALEKGLVTEIHGVIMGVADFFLPDPDEVVAWEDAVAASEADAESGESPG